MALVTIKTADSVYKIDVDDPRLCKSFDLDCVNVLNCSFCALYEPDEGFCPFAGE